VLVTLTDEELTEYKRLAMFLTAVASEPGKFPVRESLARSIKKKTRSARGVLKNDGTPKGQRSPKRLTKRSQGQQKRDRAQRRREVAEFNQAREAYEKDRIDHEAYIAERQAQIALEPKFDITDIAGNVILAGVPESMVKAVDDARESEALREYAPDIYVPGQRPDAD
jgi:hypothetical protein